MEKNRKIWSLIGLLFFLFALIWNYPFLGIYLGKSFFPLTLFVSWLSFILITRFLVNKTKKLQDEE